VPETPAAVTREAAQAAAQGTVTCFQGHANGVAAAFCSTCGTPLHQPVAAQDARPVPEAQLSEAERAERLRLHHAAVQAGKQDPGIPGYIQPQAGTQRVLIHFVEDGLTAFGTVWMRGQELEMVVDGPRWDEAARWILQDDRQQMAHYGHVKFRPGPWPGARTYTAAAGHFENREPLSENSPPVTGPSMEELRAADQREARRCRGIPVPSLR
jgi:hypothetical protein